MQLALAGICYAEHAALWCDETIDLAAYRTAAPGPLWPWKAMRVGRRAIPARTLSAPPR
jgi:hypothetical protein